MFVYIKISSEICFIKGLEAFIPPPQEISSNLLAEKSILFPTLSKRLLSNFLNWLHLVNIIVSFSVLFIGFRPNFSKLSIYYNGIISINLVANPK